MRHHNTTAASFFFFVLPVVIFRGTFRVAGAQPQQESSLFSSSSSSSSSYNDDDENDDDDVCYNTDCDLGPDALTNELGVDVPRTCVNTEQGKRCFYTYVPECASGASPLVYDIHGYLFCPLWMTFLTGWRQLADDRCFVVVWPVGNVVAGRTSRPCWSLNSGLGGFASAPHARTSHCCCLRRPLFPVGPERTGDAEFLRSIAFHVARDVVPSTTNGRASIDATRIYMAGHSNGCMASLAMAMEHSDLVAAVCCHAGSLITPPPSSSSSSSDYVPTPTWFVHGTEDDVLPYEGTSYGIGGWTPLFWPSPRDSFDAMRALNGCDADTVSNTTINIDDEGAGGFVLTAHGCDDDARVEFVTLTGADHFPYPSSTMSTDRLPCAMRGTTYNTTLAAWKFCSSYRSAREPDLDPIVVKR